MKALVLERKRELTIRDMPIEEKVGPEDVRIRIKRVGICGSDVHYYVDGYLGFRVIKEPHILGHEAAGIVIETGSRVTTLKAGDRVCMEPGVPDPESKAARLGIYNHDPAVRFWAAPPNYGCLRETVVHPAPYTFKLPDKVNLEEGAMVEPLAVGLFAATKAKIKPGDVAVVLGAGTIGMVTALAAKAGGCSQVMISDVIQEKLDLAARYGLIPVNVSREKLVEVVMGHTDGWGADIVFEASGNETAISKIFEPVCPGGRIVLIGSPGKPVPIDIYAGMVKGVTIETVFRYAHMYPKAIALIESGSLDVKPLITDRLPFEKAIEAFEIAASRRPSTIKVMIEM